MTKFGVLGAAALSVAIATPVLAQQAQKPGQPSVRAAGNIGTAGMNSARVQSNFRGPQGNVGTTNFSRGNVAARGNTQFAQQGQFAQRGEFRGDRGRRGGRDLGFAAGAAAAGVAAGAAVAAGEYGYGYSDPYYYGDDYAYDPGYYADSYAYDTGPVPVDPGPVAIEGNIGGDASYCAQRYRSYDPASGTYLGYDGLRHPCP